jgi:hypothetical protein
VNELKDLLHLACVLWVDEVKRWNGRVNASQIRREEEEDEEEEEEDEEEEEEEIKLTSSSFDRAYL